MKTKTRTRTEIVAVIRLETAWDFESHSWEGKVIRNHEGTDVVVAEVGPTRYHSGLYDRAEEACEDLGYRTDRDEIAYLMGLRSSVTGLPDASIPLALEVLTVDD